MSYGDHIRGIWGLFKWKISISIFDSFPNMDIKLNHKHFPVYKPTGPVMTVSWCSPKPMAPPVWGLHIRGVQIRQKKLKNPISGRSNATKWMVHTFIIQKWPKFQNSSNGQWSKFKSETSFGISFGHWFQKWFRIFVVTSESPIFLLPKSAIFSTLGNSKNGTFGAQHKKPKPVLESVNKTDYKTGFGF